LKGYIPIEIPTKKYIKAYVTAQLGEKPLMSTDHNIGSKFYDLLLHETNEDRTRFSNVRYNAKLKLYVSYHTFYHRGAFLNQTNIKFFNLFIEKEIKSKFRHYMDFYIEILPNFMANLPMVRSLLGIDIDAWDDDSMKKDYYRYRKRNNKSLLYKNDEPRIISHRHTDPAF
jgi:hypothetical protein